MPNTITELARRAHVSPATVSRVFSGQGYVSESTRAEILRIAKELNYAPKKYKKRNPASSGGNVIGMVIPDIRNSFYTEIIRAIEETLDKKGYELFVCDSNEDSRKEIRCLAALRQKQIGGLIITPVSDVVEYNADFLMEMNHMGIPVVLLDRDLRGGGLDGVFLDNFKGSYQATQVLVNQGHTHIAMICGPTTSKTGLERLNGDLEALRENQIPIREEYILYGDFMAPSAYALTKKLLKTQKRVTAILTANSRMSVGSLKAIAECGMSVGEDIAFMSYGRADFFEMSGSRISAVSQPVQQIGEECSKILLERIASGKRARNAPRKQIILASELLLYGSERYPSNRTR